MSSTKLNKVAVALIEIAAQRAVKPCCIRFEDCLVGKKNDTLSGISASYQEVDLSNDSEKTSHISNVKDIFFDTMQIINYDTVCHQTYCYLDLDSDLDLSDKCIIAHNVIINLNGYTLEIGGIIANIILASNGTICTRRINSLVGFYATDVELNGDVLTTNDLSIVNSRFIVSEWDNSFSRFSSECSLIVCERDENGNKKVYYRDAGTVTNGMHFYSSIHGVPSNYEEHCFDSYLVEREYRKLVNEASGKVAEAKKEAKVASERDLVIKAMVKIGTGIAQDIPLLITRNLDRLCKFECTSEICKEYSATVGYVDLSDIVKDEANRAVLLEKLISLIGTELDFSESEFEVVMQAMTQTPLAHTATKTPKAGGKKANAGNASVPVKNAQTTVQQQATKASHTCYFGSDNADKGLEYLIKQLNNKNVELSKLKITFNLDDTGDSKVSKMADKLISSATLDPKAPKELTECYKNNTVPGGMDNVVINVINLYTKLFSL